MSTPYSEIGPNRPDPGPDAGEEDKMTVTEALDYGIAAYNRGLKCAPVLDTEFIEALPKGFTPRVKCLKAWVLGWTAENLANDMGLKEETP